MNDFPKSYLDKLSEEMEKHTGQSSIAKMTADVNRALGSIDQRQLGVECAISQVSAVELMRKALGLDRMETIRKALPQQETELMQRMLGIHPSSIGEHAKKLFEEQRVKQLEEVTRMHMALGEIARPAWIGKLQADLAGSSALMDAARKAILPLSLQIGDTVRNEDLLRARISFLDRSVVSYLGPAALESIQRMWGSFTTADMLATYEPEPEGAESETRAALEGIDEAAYDAKNVHQVVLVLVDAIQKSKQPFVQRALFQILWPVILTLMSVVLAPIADHYIRKHLSESPQESSKAIQTRAAAAAAGDLAQLAQYRYVSAQCLKVRDNPRANSSAVEELQFGQAVRVVEKGDAFTLVAWSSPDGSAHVRGWAFSRYLKKFK